MSFKVGDEVYLKCVLSDTYAGKFVAKTENGVKIYISGEHLIPASRVTVAKARRAAEFPKDWDCFGFVSDDGIQWQEARLLGYNKHDSMAWITDAGSFRFAEVEE